MRWDGRPMLAINRRHQASGRGHRPGRLLSDSGGFALILTILIVSILVVVTLRFNRTMWTGLYASANLRDGIRLGCMTRSGVNCALAVLSEDAASSSSDSLLEPWALSKELSLSSARLFEQGRFQVEITDLCGRVAINCLINADGGYNETQKAFLARFLGLDRFGLEPDAVEDLMDAIKDWIDPDDETTRFGAESGYYQSLEDPYACPNGPVDSLGQLRLVKGMTDALFFGGPDTQGGIGDYLSVWGDGKININTADPVVLLALSDDMDMEMVQEMMDYRLDEANDLTDPDWYRNIPGMGHVIIDPDLIKTSSDYFEVCAEGMIEGEEIRRRITAVVRRKEGSSVQIVSWKAE
jgi:general secretion pathway protein K